MEIVSSEISSSNDEAWEIMETRNVENLLKLCQRQISFGAHRLAINCGSRIDTEVDDMRWMISTISEHLTIPLMVDSPNPKAIEVALQENKNGRMVVDSISCDRHRYESIMPMVTHYNAQVVVLLHGDEKMPESIADRIECMEIVEHIAHTYSMNKKDMYLDCLISPLSVGYSNGFTYMASQKALRSIYPYYKFTCGLDNISFGLPEEDLLNIAMTLMLYSQGQEMLFTNCTARTQAFMIAAQAILGEDEDTLAYISAYREKKLSIFLP